MLAHRGHSPGFCLLTCSSSHREKQQRDRRFCGSRLFCSYYRHPAVFNRGVETPAFFFFRSIVLYLVRLLRHERRRTKRTLRFDRQPGENALRSARTNSIAPSRRQKDADHKGGGPRYQPWVTKGTSSLPWGEGYAPLSIRRGAFPLVGGGLALPSMPSAPGRVGQALPLRRVRVQ